MTTAVQAEALVKHYGVSVEHLALTKARHELDGLLQKRKTLDLPTAYPVHAASLTGTRAIR